MNETAIHSTAIVDPGARLGTGVRIGPYAVIEADVVLGDRCVIGPRALIGSGARLAEEVQVYHAASVSCLPQDLKYSGEPTTLEIGARSSIREYVTLSRGTAEAETTRIGADCLLMAYVHVAHDCHLGDRCILANATQVAGHVKIGDWVIIGGLVAVHQFVRLGRHSFIGGGMEVTKDVPPFVTANDSPLRFCGLNNVGLRRRGFDGERIQRIRRYYRHFFGKGSGNASQALQSLEPSVKADPDARLIYEFVRASERGIIGG